MCGLLHEGSHAMAVVMVINVPPRPPTPDSVIPGPPIPNTNSPVRQPVVVMMTTQSNGVFPVVPQADGTMSPVPQVTPHVPGGSVLPPITLINVDFEPFAFHFRPIIKVFDLCVSVSPQPVNVAIVMSVMPQETISITIIEPTPEHTMHFASNSPPITPVGPIISMHNDPL
jgi:hypothetical protein